MGIMILKKISFLFLLISASFLSTSYAGRVLRFVEEPAMKVRATNQEMIRKSLLHDGVRERYLRMNTKDYGTYDPAPALVKPPFKLIPN